MRYRLFIPATLLVAFAGVMDLGGQTTTKKGGKKGATPAPAPAAPKCQITKAKVESGWKTVSDVILAKEFKQCQWTFEPEEDWLEKVAVNPAEKPMAYDEIKKHVPPAPDLEQAKQALPGLMEQVKVEALKKSESGLAPLLHPELLAVKTPVYEFFDPSKYQSHIYGRIAPAPGHRIGVQVFQMTTDHLEKFHYLLLATSHGKLVIRNILTGPAVADEFLKVDKDLAVSKVQDIIRSINSRDYSAIKGTCTEGLVSSLEDLAGWSRIVGSQAVDPKAVAMIPSVQVQDNSVRVVVRVNYPTRRGPMTYDVDFERVDNDLKVVRLRDGKGMAIAYDPNINNYVNRRFKLPDGPAIELPLTDEMRFYSVARLRRIVRNALEDGKLAKLKDLSETFIDIEPTGGEGFGIRAAAQLLAGNHDEAVNDGVQAVSKGGIAYFLVLHHFNNPQDPLKPVVLGVSKKGIHYLPSRTVSGKYEETVIPFDTLQNLTIEKPGWGGLKGSRPAIALSYRITSLEKGKEKKDTVNMTFATLGTRCTASPTPDLIAWNGLSLCGYSAGGIEILNGGGKNAQSSNSIPTYVPRDWQQSLNAILRVYAETPKPAKGK